MVRRAIEGGGGMGSSGTFKAPKSHVKVVAPKPAGLRKAMNDASTLRVTRAKSGQAAKTGAKSVEQSIAAAKAKAKVARIAKLKESIARSSKNRSAMEQEFNGKKNSDRLR